MSPADSLRIMVVGNKQVGKSALVVKFLTGRFIGEYQSDKDHKYKTTIKIDGEDISVDIADSSDPDDSAVSWADGFMIVYDVTQQTTLDKIMQLKKDLEYKKSAKNISYVVVGNKVDLKYHREVSTDTARELCLKIPAAHFECSACAANDDEATTGLHEAFEELCREIRKQKSRTVNNKPERRKSIIPGGLRRLVPTNKSRQYTCPANDVSGLSNQRSDGGKLRRRKSVAGLINFSDKPGRSRSPVPIIRVEEYGNSLSLGRSFRRPPKYGMDTLYVKQ